MYRIGIDVGGTNTDAVIMQEGKILTGVKSATTADVMSGVVESLVKALENTGINKSDVSVMIEPLISQTLSSSVGISHAQLRSGFACQQHNALPPMVDWPDDIREAVGGKFWMAKGGNEFDGRQISAIDEEELTQIAEAIQKEDITSVAICSVFSPVNDEMEKKAMAVMKKVLAGADFTLSSEIGRLGILERENAAIMNASLRSLSSRTVEAFGKALLKVGIDCPYFITQNDGTLMGTDFVKAYPVLTFASGPTNSMRGASYLTGEQNAIVIDVGGTSTDVGALIKGFQGQRAQLWM